MIAKAAKNSISQPSPPPPTGLTVTRPSSSSEGEASWQRVLADPPQRPVELSAAESYAAASADSLLKYSMDDTSGLIAANPNFMMGHISPRKELSINL